MGCLSSKAEAASSSPPAGAPKTTKAVPAAAASSSPPAGAPKTTKAVPAAAAKGPNTVMGSEATVAVSSKKPPNGTTVDKAKELANHKAPAVKKQQDEKAESATKPSVERVSATKPMEEAVSSTKPVVEEAVSSTKPMEETKQEEVSSTKGATDDVPQNVPSDDKGSAG